MSYSPQLVYFLDRMSGFSTNTFKLMPSGSDVSGPNSITRITLPSNALLNTRSFKLHFMASIVEGSSIGARLPADISSLVERIEISAGGVQLSQGTNFYNTLVNAKAALQGSRCDSVTGHSELVRKNKFDGSDDILDTEDLNELYTGTGTPHVIDKWEGFLGTCEPKILDASILPDLVVSIYWASNTVLASCSQADTHDNFKVTKRTGAGTAESPYVSVAKAVYDIRNIHATIETIGLADSVYDNMVASQIASAGYVEIPFKNHFSFSNTHTGSSRFTIATQSLDRIITAWRAADFDTLGAPHPVPGYSVAAGAASAATSALSLSAYGGAHGTGAVEKYITKHQRFTEPGADGALKYQFQLNGSFVPQYPAGMEDMYQITKNSLEGSVKYGMTKEQLRDSYFVQCIRLNMPDSEKSRTMSGLDTRSVSLNGYVNTTGVLSAANPNLMIFCECTSSVRVGAGRQLEVII